MTLWNCWIVVRLFLIPIIGGISYKRRKWLIWWYAIAFVTHERAKMSYKPGRNVTQAGPKCHTRAKMSHSHVIMPDKAPAPHCTTPARYAILTMTNFIARDLVAIVTILLIMLAWLRTECKQRYDIWHADPLCGVNHHLFVTPYVNVALPHPFPKYCQHNTSSLRP